ncbi:MAG: hypothetical protein EA409_13115 [Saprospirales bacterium]|nr:MAG: hypothetical protein EA409_13115 [Saprospirales bacterium]
MDNQVQSKDNLSKRNINVPIKGKLSKFLTENRGKIGLAAGVLATTTFVSAKNFQPIKKVEDINPELAVLSDEEMLEEDGTYLSIEVGETIYLPSDGLSFSDAFTEAREKMGPGGIFEWEGKHFNTYFAEEWEVLSKDQKMEFATRVSETISEKDSGIVEVEDGKLMTTEFSSENILKLTLENPEVRESLEAVEIDIENESGEEISIEVDFMIKEPSSPEEIMNAKDILIVDSREEYTAEEYELESPDDDFGSEALSLKEEATGLEFDDIPEKKEEKNSEETDNEQLDDHKDIDEYDENPFF